MIPINKVAAVDKGCPRGPGAAPLPKGAVIGPASHSTATPPAWRSCCRGIQTGPWLGLKIAILGFEFYTMTKTLRLGPAQHAGFLLLSLYRRILGYAYETVPGKAIVAGDEGNSTNALSSPPSGTCPRRAGLGPLAEGTRPGITRQSGQSRIPLLCHC